MSFHDDLLDQIKCVARKSKENPNGLTVDELKLLCKQNSLPYSGTKEVMCKRLIAFYKENKPLSIPIPVPQPTQSKPQVITPVKVVKVKVKTVVKGTAPKIRIKALKPQLAVNPVKIGQGSSGCVYTPRFDCDPSEPIEGDLQKLNSKNTVSKISNAAEAEDEFDIYKRIKLDQFDPTESYHIGKPAMCKPLNMTRICTVVTTPNPLQLIYENGGVSLHNFKSRDYAKSTLIGLSNVVRGINQLNQAGIYHFDIKPDNIVIDKKTGICRLIDFGLAYQPSMGKEHLAIFQNIYKFWPPDANVFIPYRQDGTTRNLNWYRKIVQKFYNSIGSLKIYSGLNVNAVASELHALHQQHTPEELFNESMRKVDIFSLAVTIYLLSEGSQDVRITGPVDEFLTRTNALSYNPFIRPDSAEFYRAYKELVIKISV
jgi:serine/threonine protein kinase